MFSFKDGDETITSEALPRGQVRQSLPADAGMTIQYWARRVRALHADGNRRPGNISITAACFTVSGLVSQPAFELPEWVQRDWKLISPLGLILVSLWGGRAGVWRRG